MFLLNAEVTLNWTLGVTTNTIVNTDLDLIIISPLGESTYLNSPISAPNFTAPSATVEGAASYLFTPTLQGRWNLYLVTGTDADYRILSKVEMQVFDNNTTVPFASYSLPSGPPGVDGTDGIDGLDGAAGLDGIQGIQGIQGTTGADGSDGISAYEVAVINGFVGTEAQWLVSLEGTDGIDGNTGAAGADGIDGTDGVDGGVAEQGTWPATLNDQSGNTGSIVLEGNSNWYIRVGNMVTANLAFINAGVIGLVSTDIAEFRGLPYTVKEFSSGHVGKGNSLGNLTDGGGDIGITLTCWADSADNTIKLEKWSTSNGSTAGLINNITAAGEMRLQVSYLTDQVATGGEGGSGTMEGIDILSTGEAGGIKFLREDGDGTSSWQSVPGTGGDLLAANNLSDVANAITSLANLGGEPAKGADDNYVTDAEAIVIGNTSGTNTGDQTIPVSGVDFDPLGTDNDSNPTPNITDNGISNAITIETNGQITLSDNIALNSANPFIRFDNNFVGIGTLWDIIALDTNGELRVRAYTASGFAIESNFIFTADGDLSLPGDITAANVSGINTGDSAVNTLYANDYRAANFIAGTNYEPAKGTDDNFVTDAEKTVIGNTSGTNTGDEDKASIEAVLTGEISTHTHPVGVAPTIVLKTSDEAISNSTTLQDDATLKFIVEANATYRAEVFLVIDSPSNGDFKYDFNVPASVTYAFLGISAVGTGTEFNTSIVDGVPVGGTGFATSGTGNSYLSGSLLVKTGGTAGTVILEWAQNALDFGFTTVKAGSHLTWTKLS